MNISKPFFMVNLGLILGVILGLIMSLVLGFILGLILDLSLVWILGLNLDLILGLISGLILGLILGRILGWIKNNKARHNLSNVKCRQMAFRLVDGAVVGSFFGFPWSHKSNAQPPEGDYIKFVLICLNIEANRLSARLAPSLAGTLHYITVGMLFCCSAFLLCYVV